MSTVLVTGATDGLGRALGTRLAGDGVTVVAHARSEERGREALAELLDGPGDVRLVVGDLASLSEVRALADQVPDRLDVLVNNAGIGFAEARAESEDGYELRFAVNYLAGFLLASLLRDRLAASAPG
jgi:NAD(P)-dependent dehydrogenase (short-subunit alcohol dehydrogenase family)